MARCDKCKRWLWRRPRWLFDGMALCRKCAAAYQPRFPRWYITEFPRKGASGGGEAKGT